MTPKDKGRYKIAFENMENMLDEYDTDEELPEMIIAIRRAEYKRGKADGIKETLDDNSILHGDDADRFVENMIKAETEPPTERQKELMKEIKENREAGYFDVEPTKPNT